MATAKQLVVIGGGWGGIAAAMEATRLGLPVLLAEERPYMGGRARSFIDRATDTEIDNGQHVMMGCYHETLRVLRELGTAQHLERQQALRVVFTDRNGKRDVLDASKAPGRLGVLMGIMLLKRLSMRGKLMIVRFANRVDRGLIRAGDKPCLDLLISEHQTTDAIERFWEPLVLAALNAHIEVADASLLIAVMKQAFFAGGNDSSLYLPRVGLSTLVEPFEQWMRDHDAEVLLSTSVDRLNIDGDTVVSVELSNGDVREVDAIVSAIPARALARLLPTSGVVDFTPSPIVSVYLWYDEPWLTDDFVAILNSDVQWIFRKRVTNGQLVALTISAASSIVDKTSDDIIAYCDDELRKTFSSMKNVQRVHGQVIKEKSATPLLNPRERFMRKTGHLHVPKNLAIAGDWTDTGLPATIEGAARSGVSAVHALALH